jgi:hydroxymethylbilane synthase|tara:strand:+ start:343 stop:1251 length:909 start_codon:yes stop_codon:yes gene_type:complete
MKSKKIIIGSRGSKLALIYAERAKTKILEFFPEVDIKKITTTGDINQKDRLSEIGGKGLFLKQIENELLSEKIDIAVHALKDMPSNETEGLLTNCFLERNDPREVLINNSNNLIKDLRSNSIIGTSSFRREFQLKKIRNDLNYKLIRGNVDTRIKKLNEKLYDAIILSYAGIHSLKLDINISQIFSTKEIIPSVGQGIIALQCRKNDFKIIKLLDNVNHKPTNICAAAERQFLKVLEGDCETAVGAIANLENEKINLEAELFSIDGKQRFYHKASKNINLSLELGKEVGEILKKESNNSYKR